MSDTRITPRPASEHAEIILAGILPDNVPRLYSAQKHITADHFSTRELGNVYQIICHLVEVTGHLPTVDSFVDLIGSQHDSGTVTLYRDIFERLTVKDVLDSDFSWSMQALREQHADRETGNVLTTAMRILREGEKVGKESLHGATSAREYTIGGFADIESTLRLSDAPEGTINEERSEMEAEYAAVKQRRIDGKLSGVCTGVEALDDALGGFHPGELALVIGFTSEGKTGLVVQTAWHAAFMQGLNVFFATSETLRAQVRRRMVARHSRLPQFACVDGLNSNAIKSGMLTDDEEGVYNAVIADMQSAEYGKLHIAQIPSGSTIESLAARLRTYNMRTKLDLVVIDYIPLLKPIRSRNTFQAEMSETVKAAKILAASFDDGRGVPVISPWQVSRNAYEQAQSFGGYTLSSLSDTSEAEKSSDIVVSMFLPQDQRIGGTPNIDFQVLKNRDGERMDKFLVTADYATSFYSSTQRPSPRNRAALLPSGGYESILDVV